MVNNKIENISWTTNEGGVIVEPTEGYSNFYNDNLKNNSSSSYPYLKQRQEGASLIVSLNGKDFGVRSFVHDHPYIEGGMNDEANKFSGRVYKYPDGSKIYYGDIGFYQAYKDRGIQINMYLIGPKDVVKYTPGNHHLVVGGTFGLINGANFIK